MASIFAALHDLMIVLILIIAGLSLLLKLVQWVGNTQKSNANPDKDLQNELIRLAGGDRKTAARLFNGVRAKYPGESNTWYYERTISDLLRDRR